MMRYLFTRSSNPLDMISVGCVSALFVAGHWIAAIASIIGLSIISVAGEIYIREHTA